MQVSHLRYFGMVEQASCILLFFVAMPLKYLAGMPMAVTIVGGAHGALFTLFVLLLLVVGLKHGFSLKLYALCFIGAIPPFGFFLYDKALIAHETHAGQPSAA